MNVDASKPHESNEPGRGLIGWLIWIASEDHCQWANRYVYWLKTPLGILLAGALFALLCGIFVAPQALVIFAVIATVVVVGLAWPWIAVRGVRCRLEFTAHRGREGKPTPARLIVTNKWPWPVWGLAVDEPAFALDNGVHADAAGTTVALARIDGWSRSTYHWTLTPPKRGVFPSHDVRIATGFPFGLRRASRSIEVSAKLVIWPKTFWLPPLHELQSRRHWSGDLCEAHVGFDGTRIGVRDYRHGDSLRDVHWAKSARHERLIVSEREAAVIEDHMVAVDVDPTRHAGVGGDSTLEWSLRIAASICESVVGQQGRVQLWLGGQRISAGSRTNDLARLLDEIAKFDTDASSRRGALNLPDWLGAANAIRIGADDSAVLGGRAILLQRRAFGKREAPSEPYQTQWINVDSPIDVPGQILKGWRCTNRRLRHAS